MSPIDDAAALISRSQAIAMSAHIAPDPDAIGSVMGLGLALQSAGKKVAILSSDPPPGSVTFLPGIEQIQHTLPEGFEPDLFIGLDSSDPQRLGDIAQPLLTGSIPVLNIDHHVTNLNYGAVNLVDTSASSCAEVVVGVLNRLNIPIDKSIATCLLTGIIGDTRGFSTSNVNAQALKTAATLLEAGADLREINENLVSNRSLNELRLLGLGLNNFHFDDGMIWSAVTFEERKAANLVDFHQSGMSNMLLTVPEANVSAAFTELSDGKVEVSMRARPGYNVSTIALSLGGGGHPAAAGCTIDGPLDTAVKRVLDLIRTTAKAG